MMSDTEPDVAGLADALPDVEPHGTHRENSLSARPFWNIGKITSLRDPSIVLRRRVKKSGL